jgi:hypothetical protein
MKKLFYRLFKRYKILEKKFVPYAEADQLIKCSSGKPEDQRWVLAKEEDTNKCYGMVYLCRKERIFE